MADRTSSKPSPRAADGTLDSLPLADAEEVAERRAGSARVVHEVVRLSGEEELARPALSLFFSALAGGLAISTSVSAKSFLKAALPDAGWAHLVVSFGYTVGFIIVILGRLQLFTESTITAILPLATRPTWSKLGRTVRLWAIVFGANMLGTFLVAAILNLGFVGTPETRSAMIAVSREMLPLTAGDSFRLGVPAGFMIASVPWILPNARGAEFWVVFLITWTIGIGGYAHVVAGSTEAWMLWLSGAAGAGWTFGSFLGPALVGNILGGTGLFALLAHGQVRQELAQERVARQVEARSKRSFFRRIARTSTSA